jgi:hypothetical protein
MLCPAEDLNDYHSEQSRRGDELQPQGIDAYGSIGANGNGAIGAYGDSGRGANGSVCVGAGC